MKGIIPFLVVIALIGTAGGLLFTQLNKDLDEARFFSELHKQRIRFVEQAANIRRLPDDKVKFDRAQLIGWHIKQVEKLYVAHPEQKVTDRFIKELEEKESGKKTKDTARLDRFKERYDWLKSVWDKTVSRGDYDTLLTQEKNGIRIDILGMSPWVPPEGGKQSLRLDLLMWGPVVDHISFKGLTLQFIREIESTDSRGRVTKKKAIAKIEGGGPPNVLHPSGPNPEPEKWLLAWPPGVSAGYYTGLPLFAPDATIFSFAMDIEIRTHGGTLIPMQFKWEGIEVKPEWRAPAGSEWDAEVGEASDEELAAAGLK